MMIKLIKAISNNTKMIKILTLAALLGITVVGTSCNQPAGNSSDNSTDKISPEQVDANIKKSGIAKNVELPTTIQSVSYKLILSASSGTFNASKNERAANNSYSGSFFYKDSYVFINIEDDSTFLKIFVDKVLDEMNKQAVKAKSEIEDTAFIISSNKISTSITSDDYTNAKTNFNDKIEDYLTGLTEVEPPAEEPPAENPPAEDPFIDDPSVSQSLKESAEYKLLREVGFAHITGVDVPVEEGKYQPKTGEIVELYYNNRGLYPTTYTLNRELSKDGHLVYDGSCYKEIYGLDSMQTWTGEEFNFDVKNKTLTHYIPDPDEDPASYQYSYIKINDDGSFVLGGYKNTPNDGSLYEMPVEFNKSENSVDLYMDISFKLANETKQEP